MKKIKFLLTATIVIGFTSLNAQIKAPKPSPLAEVEQTIGLTEIEVEYSRPGKKGREIFGALVKYDEIWRTGANASTKFETSEDIKVGGQELKAGKYALYTIPGKEEWTIIFHNNLKHWGVGDYKQEEDALRIKVKPIITNKVVETFTIGFSHLTNNGAKMTLAWDVVEVSFDITVDTDAQLEKQINAVLLEGPSAGDYASGARYYMEKGKDLDKALAWINKAIDKKPDAFWYIHDKAKLLAKMNKKNEAITAANKSIEVAKANKQGDYGYIKKNEELIKGLK